MLNAVNASNQSFNAIDGIDAPCVKYRRGYGGFTHTPDMTQRSSQGGTVARNAKLGSNWVNQLQRCLGFEEVEM